MTDIVYSAFGLGVRLPFGTPLLSEATAGRMIDIDVQLSPTPEALVPAARHGKLEIADARIEASESGGLLWITDHTRVWMPDPSLILVEPLVERSWGARKRLLLYGCLPAALAARGFIVLHATAIQTPAGAVAVVGPSGSGKSTLLAGLLNEGSLMLSDDVSTIRCQPGREIEVLPGYPTYRLHPQAVKRLSPVVEKTTRPPMAPKVILRVVGGSHSSGPAPLRLLLILGGDHHKDLRIARIGGVEALNAVQENGLPPLCLWPRPSDIERVAHLVSSTPVYRVIRPMGVWTLDELVNWVLTRDEHRPPRWSSSGG